jgi:hypothetical protein
LVISQFGKIIRIDTKSVRAAGRSTSGVRLLNLESDDKVASAHRHPPPRNPRPTGRMAGWFSDENRCASSFSQEMWKLKFFGAL